MKKTCNNLLMVIKNYFFDYNYFQVNYQLYEYVLKQLWQGNDENLYVRIKCPMFKLFGHEFGVSGKRGHIRTYQLNL